MKNVHAGNLDEESYTSRNMQSDIPTDFNMLHLHANSTELGLRLAILGFSRCYALELKIGSIENYKGIVELNNRETGGIRWFFLVGG